MLKKEFVLYQDDSSPAVKDDDRRRHERYRVGVFTEIDFLPGAESSPAITYNMSRSGALLLTLEPFVPGQDVTMSFVSRDDRREITRARVVYGSPLDRGTPWRQKVGVEFLDQPPQFFSSEITRPQG